MVKQTYSIALRWQDFDAYGHLNNVAAMRLLEEARIAAFWADENSNRVYRTIPEIGHDDSAHARQTTQTIVTAHSITYHKPINYGAKTIAIELWVSQLQAASATVNYRVGDQITASTTLALIDAKNGQVRRWGKAQREKFEGLMG